MSDKYNGLYKVEKLKDIETAKKILECEMKRVYYRAIETEDKMIFDSPELKINKPCTATEIEEQMRYEIMKQRLKEMESKALEKADGSDLPKERKWSFADRSKIDVAEVKEDIQERLKGFTTSQLKMELDRRMKERR